MQKVFKSFSEQDTAALAIKLASIAKKGDVFALYGTLGMGKSIFARSFIKELTDAAEVPSPTFTLVQSYDAKDFVIHHFDLYRLKSPDEVFELGFEEAIYDGVCLIEWPEKAGSWLPKNLFKVTFMPDDSSRIITVASFSDEKTKRLETIK